MRVCVLGLDVGDGAPTLPGSREKLPFVPNTEPTGTQNRRPHPNLLKYYVLESLLLGPLFWIILIPRYLRYRTLNYHWDEQGITARWGVMFRREISLDFERIQDIHLSSNLVERWLGLAKVQVQTASASSKAEMTIEGLQDYSEVRDFLYRRMRGVRDADSRARSAGAGESAESESASVATVPKQSDELATQEVVRALRETAAELRALREELTARSSAPASPTSVDSGVDPE